MNRRQALSTLAAAGTVSFAGCSSVLGSEGIVLGRIEVINSSFVANGIRLMVQRDEEVLLDRKITLPGIDAETGTPATLIPPVWSDKKGAYTVTAIHYDTSDNRESGKYEYTFTREDYDAYYGDDHEDPGCLGAVVKIGSLSETENDAIGVGPMDMETPCGTPDSQ
ncbi:hypothetical protein [Halorubellus sp. PRR65]|uniref:hypothetical protein n=1 Tax=Halorubellus sp. PRR65 TaxID=3098148 RepID=UPI002B25E0F0|nr:hypothetical protein [Halorubellus sp. PRR65]